MTPLTVEELQHERQERATVNHATYKQLLGQVQDRLRIRATNNFTDLLWPVPPLVPGRPVYKVSHAARYITDKLRRGGFEVTTAAPEKDVHVLYITWSPVPARPPPAKKTAAPAKPSTAAASAPVSVAEATRRLEKLKARLQL